MGGGRLVLWLATLAAGALLPGAVAQAVESSFVRVDQVGYASQSPKRAYVLSRHDETGAPYSVVRESDGATLAQGTLGASSGSWSKRFGDGYAGGFDAV